MKIETASAATLSTDLSDFADMLTRSVEQGASIGFVQPFDRGAATAFWRDSVAPAVRHDRVVLMCARHNRRVVGTVQLVLPTMPNQAHKAEVGKMMVHPDHRREGIGRSLMEALIEEARKRGFRLLTLDTRTGDTAQPLYAAFGFQVAGEIPGFAIDPHDPEKLDGTTYMYKWL